MQKQVQDTNEKLARNQMALQQLKEARQVRCVPLELLHIPRLQWACIGAISYKRVPSRSASV